VKVITISFIDSPGGEHKYKKAGNGFFVLFTKGASPLSWAHPKEEVLQSGGAGLHTFLLRKRYPNFDFFIT
jgi:hypothetical protein